VDADEKPVRYTLTDDGETEFVALLREALWQVVPNDPARLYTAISFMWALSREEVVDALETGSRSSTRSTAACPTCSGR
jgi:hypothetical protein